jgi:hypothetical protein
MENCDENSPFDLVHSYKKDVSAVAKHLKWPEMKVQAAGY